ncbi:MAG: glycosyltransferase family 4 protein [Halobacteriales archaeon]|nr:glycosyltransferase family 4 protein [Halobacteriales archaeon]
MEAAAEPMKDLAFLHTARVSFVQEDLDILQRRFDVEEVVWRGKGSLPAVALAVARTRGHLSWFCGDHTYAASMAGVPLRKPGMVIVGGGDASYVAELGPGAAGGVFGDPVRAGRARFSYRRAAGIFPVDESLRQDLLGHTGLDGSTMVTIPTGYDPERWKPDGPKEPLVLTVAGVNRGNLQRKGLRTFARAAVLVPEARWAIVGAWQDDAADELRKDAPRNLDFAGEASGEELLRWYQRATVYCQLSRHEGLPNALCEAMLCACVPVGTPHYGIPGAIGDTGPIVPWNDVEATALAVRDALHRDSGEQARARIAGRFPKAKREEELPLAVEQCLAGRAVRELPFFGKPPTSPSAA